MTALIEKLVQYWAYPFVRYALAVGVLVALCASLLGVTLVLRRFSFIGDGLSHVAFGAMSVASVLNLTSDMPLVMGVCDRICAINFGQFLACGSPEEIQKDRGVQEAYLGVSEVE